MAQDPIGDLRKKRQREQQEKEISRYQDDAAYKSARERLAKGPSMSDNKKGTREGQAQPSGQARMSSYNEGFSRLSAQSADHNRKQEYLERPDTPLAATPEPKRK